MKHRKSRVVITADEYGTADAASVASDMLSTFRNIWIGLRVGIGSGAPSRRNDIRLGDIVVGAPRDGNGGVLKYDFTRTMLDQTLQVTCTGFLTNLPTSNGGN